MNFSDAHFNMEYFCGCGTIFSTEEKASLQNSLIILKKNYKFSSLKFWGKIIGTCFEYYIAKGVEKHEFQNVKFLYR